MNKNIRYTLEHLGVNDYDHFIQWGFTEDPAHYELKDVLPLWKHHDKCPILPEEYIPESIARMAQLYLLENRP